jgi:hypothetical protein
MARHAVNHGWIASQALQAVRREKKQDEAAPSEFERLMPDL